MGVVHTSEFQQSFEAQTARMLRPRFMWFLGTIGLFYLLSLVVVGSTVAIALSQVLPGGAQTANKLIGQFRWGMGGVWGLGGLVAIDLAVYAWCWWRILRRPMGRSEMVRFTQRYTLFRGLMDMAGGFLSMQVGFPWWIMFYHVLACVFLPWSPAQAMKPIGPLLVVNALLILLFRESTPMIKALVMVLSLFAAAPGVGIAALKQSRRAEQFRLQMLQARYGQMRQELVDARRIHEALFPEPVREGPVHLEYRYEPMRQIGGDYLYARFAPGRDGGAGAFNVLLLDVTGHGIAAALTVNRLYGEVERLYAENPHTGPGEVLSALNRYVHLTLANHSIYATALCMRIDHERGVIEYASGGHPPAYLCTADGKIDSLDSTALVLGACMGPDFDPSVREKRFEVGDRLLAYTDGAIEARGENGKMLGLSGLLRVLAASVGQRDGGGAGLAATVLSAVESHRYGPPEDDTLVVELVRVECEQRAGGREEVEFGREAAAVS